MAKYNAKQVADALHDAQGIVRYAAAKLGCTRKTIYNYINKYPTVAEALEDSRESQIDYVESKLLEQIKEGNTTAIIFYLKTQGKNRGYSERTEVTGKDGGAITTTNVTIESHGVDDARAILEQLKALNITDDNDTTGD